MDDDAILSHQLSQTKGQYGKSDSRSTGSVRVNIPLSRGGLKGNYANSSEFAMSIIKAGQEGLFTYERGIFNSQAAAAVNAMTLVQKAAERNFPGMSDYYKTDPYGKVHLANYLLRGELPVGKHWGNEDRDYLKSLGDRIFSQRESLLGTEKAKVVFQYVDTGP